MGSRVLHQDAQMFQAPFPSSGLPLSLASLASPGPEEPRAEDIRAQTNTAQAPVRAPPENILLVSYSQSVLSL